MSVTAQHLSGTPANGRLIPVAATASPGTLIHTATANPGEFDEIDLFAANISGAAVLLTVEWGGTTSGDHLVADYSIPANSNTVPIAMGLRLNGGAIVRAFCSSANNITISGRVNRIT